MCRWITGEQHNPDGCADSGDAEQEGHPEDQASLQPGHQAGQASLQPRKIVPRWNSADIGGKTKDFWIY